MLKKLAMMACSKILGIGSAERSWKKIKKNKGGDRSKLSTDKAKMQATIAGIHAAENNDQDRAKRLRAGVIWEDSDFETLGLDANCLPLDVAPDEEVAKRSTRIFRAWREEWEDVDCGPYGCPILEQKILRKYGGLKFIDPDSGQKFTVHPDRASFQKERKANRYELFCILDGFDEGVDDDDQVEMWEPWTRELAIDEIVEYCKANPSEGVVLYYKGDIPDSGDEGSGDEDSDGSDEAS